MSKEFKVGQVVKYVGNEVGPRNWFKIGTRFNIVEKCDNPDVWISENLQQAEPGELNRLYSSEFEIVKDIQEFDMKKEKWFIRTPTPEISKLVQEWLFEQGFEWRASGKEITNLHYQFIINNEGGNYMFKSDFPFKGEEIKLTLKTIIDSVEYPSVETEQQKQIRELEETIAKAAEQIKSLKGEK